MRLLFDENISRCLCQRLSDVFPDSEHVSVVGLEHASDTDVWIYAKAMGRTIVTKDSDFHHLSFLHGAPPKVVWLR
jgi:predicted nuclease of predicted toxin-antitoxin system